MKVMRSLRFILVSLVVVAAILPSKGRAQTKKEGWVGIVFTTGIGQTNSNGTLYRVTLRRIARRT